jgi:carbamate kinase
MYTEEEALRLSRERGFAVARDGDGFRRVVPSPEPRRVREIRTLRLLVDAGIVVVCSGGGGIPVMVTPSGAVRGVEAVIDKDLSASLVARDLNADLLLLLTDVEGLWADWKKPSARLIRETTPAELRAGAFATGSMGPKVEACCRFVEATGKVAAIGALEQALAIVRGDAGTRVRASGPLT